MNTIQSHDVVVDDIVYRSKTEARWAILFARSGVQFEYEPRAFTIPEIGGYVPDFYLPKCHGGCWIEIKGKAPTAIEQTKAIELHRITQQPVVILYGAYELLLNGSGDYDICNFGMLIVKGRKLIHAGTITPYSSFLSGLLGVPYKRIVEEAEIGAWRIDSERNIEGHNFNLWSTADLALDLISQQTGQRNFRA